MSQEREWWETEMLVARAIGSAIAPERLSKLLTDFLLAWDKRNGNALGLDAGTEPVLMLELGDRATPENALDRTVILIAKCTETIANLVARAAYAKSSGAVRVFLFCPSFVCREDAPALEEVCDAFFFADPTAGGDAPRTLGTKGVVLRTVALPQQLDPTQKFFAAI